MHLFLTQVDTDFQRSILIDSYFAKFLLLRRQNLGFWVKILTKLSLLAFLVSSIMKQGDNNLLLNQSFYYQFVNNECRLFLLLLSYYNYTFYNPLIILIFNYFIILSGSSMIIISVISSVVLLKVLLRFVPPLTAEANQLVL